jgi:hypothetical protein
MIHNLRIADDDYTIQSNQEHVARAYAEEDAARSVYLKQRIAETADEDKEFREKCNPYRNKPKPPPHVKPSGSNGLCIVCRRKTGPCFSLDSPYRKENQNVQD